MAVMLGSLDSLNSRMFHVGEKLTDSCDGLTESILFNDDAEI